MSLTRRNAVGALLGAGFACTGAAAQDKDGGAEAATVILVRHAEREVQGEDPPLTEAGRKRAGQLAHVLAKAGVRAVYVTRFRRTRQTAQPLADALKLELTDTPASAEFVRQVRARYAGQVVVVVGHSNTVPQIIEAFGAGEVTGVEQQFDDLFVLHVPPQGKADLLYLRYGEPSPAPS